MSEPLVPPSSPPAALPPRPWYLRPYLHVAVSTLLTAASQPLLKRGADAAAEQHVLAISALRSGWTWLAIVAIIASLLSWIYALRFVPLNIAFSLTGSVQVLVPVASWVFLGDSISLQRWSGIALVTVGVLLTAREAVKLEEKL